MKRSLGWIAAVLLALGCSDSRRYDQAVGVLIDVSGTYADQKQQVVNIIKRDVLPAMVPGDTLLVVRIDSKSYDPENIEALLTLDYRPSQAQAQKLGVARKLDAFASNGARSRLTDIQGAMMLSSEYLREIGSGSQVMLVFSDLLEELPPGTVREMKPGELDGIHVVAMNVKRLYDDRSDPEVFRARLASWETRLARAGAAEWRVIQDSTHLSGYLAGIR